jgi:hypothetical protein
MDTLSRRDWMRAAGGLAAYVAAGGSQIQEASAQPTSAEALIGALKAARVFDLSFT